MVPHGAVSEITYFSTSLQRFRRMHVYTPPGYGMGGQDRSWFATGTDDFLIETSRATVAMLKSHGFDVTFKETTGGHTWVNWREYLREFSQSLFQEGTVPSTGSAPRD